jgi:hypothetical protein
VNITLPDRYTTFLLDNGQYYLQGMSIRRAHTIAFGYM